MRTRIGKWCNLLTTAQGRVYTSTSAFRLHSRAIPLQPLTLPIARDRAQWGNYLRHDRYSSAISWNPFHGLTAEISWHAPASDFPPASWQLYCLVTWTKQHHCLTGRQNDNKLIFMNSLNSFPSVICFLYFLFLPFAGFYIYEDWIFAFPAIPHCSDGITLQFAISLCVQLDVRMWCHHWHFTRLPFTRVKCLPAPRVNLK